MAGLQSCCVQVACVVLRTMSCGSLVCAPAGGILLIGVLPVTQLLSVQTSSSSSLKPGIEGKELQGGIPGRSVAGGLLNPHSNLLKDKGLLQWFDSAGLESHCWCSVGGVLSGYSLFCSWLALKGGWGSYANWLLG